MVTDLVLELDYHFLHISALEDVYINSALYKCFLLTYVLRNRLSASDPELWVRPRGKDTKLGNWS